MMQLHHQPTSKAAIVEAVVTDIRLQSREGATARWQIALDPAVFAAMQPEAAASQSSSASLVTSPGSPIGTLEAVARSGARLEVAVLELIEQEGVLWCVVEKPLLVGTRVRVQLR